MEAASFPSECSRLFSLLLVILFHGLPIECSNAPAQMVTPLLETTRELASHPVRNHDKRSWVVLFYLIFITDSSSFFIKALCSALGQSDVNFFRLLRAQILSTWHARKAASRDTTVPTQPHALTPPDAADSRTSTTAAASLYRRLVSPLLPQFSFPIVCRTRSSLPTDACAIDASAHLMPHAMPARPVHRAVLTRLGRATTLGRGAAALMRLGRSKDSPCV